MEAASAAFGVKCLFTHYLRLEPRTLLTLVLLGKDEKNEKTHFGTQSIDTATQLMLVVQTTDGTAQLSDIRAPQNVSIDQTPSQN